MPYIKREDRDRLLSDDEIPKTAGELNYLITQLMCSYVQTHGLNYAHINDVIGACEGAKIEFYRRVAAPYEDIKIKENGDIPFYSTKRG